MQNAIEPATVAAAMDQIYAQRVLMDIICKTVSAQIHQMKIVKGTNQLADMPLMLVYV